MRHLMFVGLLQLIEPSHVGFKHPLKPSGIISLDQLTLP